MKVLLLLACFAVYLASPVENMNGIYLGNDVSSALVAHQDVAVWIAPTGVVTVWIGATIPGLHDAQGRDVTVRSVKTLKR